MNGGSYQADIDVKETDITNLEEYILPGWLVMKRDKETNKKQVPLIHLCLRGKKVKGVTRDPL